MSSNACNRTMKGSAKRKQHYPSKLLALPYKMYKRIAPKPVQSGPPIISPNALNQPTSMNQMPGRILPKPVQSGPPIIIPNGCNQLNSMNPMYMGILPILVQSVPLIINYRFNQLNSINQGYPLDLKSPKMESTKSLQQQQQQQQQLDCSELSSNNIQEIKSNCSQSLIDSDGQNDIDVIYEGKCRKKVLDTLTID